MEEIITQFVKAGLVSIPGGGGEIFVDSVRNRISPLKAMTDDWLGVMDVAHRLGLKSTATMMFGHVETIADRIEYIWNGCARSRTKPVDSQRLSRGHFKPNTLA